MNIVKKFSLLLVVSLIAVVLVACGSGDSKDSSSSDKKSDSGDKIVIRTSHVTQEGSVIDKTHKKFKEVLEELSDGQVEVQVYPAGQLGSTDDDTVEGMRAGTFEVGSAPSLVLSNFVPQYAIFDFPYLFRNNDEVKAFVDSDIYQNEVAKPFEEKTGLKILGNYGIGWMQVLNAKRAVNEPADLKGLSLRSATAQVQMDTLEAWGANPTPMAFGEVFTAIQQGAVDGLSSTPDLMTSDKFYEPAKYLTLTDHIIIVHVLMINEEFFNSLSEDIQGHVIEAAKQAVEYGWSLEREHHNNGVETMKQAGVEVTELTPEMKEKFIEASKPAIDKNIDLVGEDFYKKAEEVAEQAR